MRLRLASTALCTVLLLGAPTLALAQTTSAHAGSPRRTPASPHAFALATGTALTLGAGLSSFFDPSPTIEPVRTGVAAGVLFDEDFRASVRLVDIDDQERARRVSDVFLLGTMLGVTAIDTIIAPLVNEDPDLAWQSSFAHVLALGITLSLGDVIKRVAERPRPFTRECEENPQRPGCTDSDSHHSFYSLHTGMAFTSAGFSCAMHLTRTLYDDPVADGAACGGALAMAATTGLLRILSDRHYLTDVLVGGALGFLVGYLIPLALVPERRPARAGGEIEAAPAATGWAVAPLISPAAVSPSTGTAPLGIGTFGLSAFGTF